MTKTLDVLVVGSDPLATERGASGRSQARATGSTAAIEPGETAFPCVGLTDPDRCPLDQAIDVTLLVRRGIHPRPMPAEDGVRCAIRAGVPIVEDGSDFYDPFDPWVARRVGPSDDVVAECVAAADRRFDQLRALVRERIARLAAAAGTSANEVTCRIEPTGRRPGDRPLRPGPARPTRSSRPSPSGSSTPSTRRVAPTASIDVNVHGATG